MSDETVDLRLPWSFRHTDSLADYGYLVDADGKEVCTFYNIFGAGKDKYIEHLLGVVNPKKQEESAT